MELLLQAERLLTVGQIDAAERLYQQTIESDPRNSIAVVGLARVALERHDERTAYEFARRALEIDADNVAAQRLVIRLAEVMLYRGEQPPAAPLEAERATPSAAPPVGAPGPLTGNSPAAPRRRGFIGRLRGR